MRKPRKNKKEALSTKILPLSTGNPQRNGWHPFGMFVSSKVRVNPQTHGAEIITRKKGNFRGIIIPLGFCAPRTAGNNRKTVISIKCVGSVAK